MPNSARLLLLLDTDPEFSYLIDRYSRTIGWRVTRSSGVEEALAQIRSERPAMILLNLLLPPGGGWEALRALKVSAEAQGIPITVYSSLPDEERAWREGANACLWKPVMLEEFIAAVESAAHLAA